MLLNGNTAMEGLSGRVNAILATDAGCTFGAHGCTQANSTPIRTAMKRHR